MNDFPLTPFLVALHADDIRVTLSDYERIITVLRAGGPWTVQRLRGALMALLVHSREQEEAFARCFDSFFDLSLETPYSPEEIALALENLRRLAGHSGGPPAPLPPAPLPAAGRGATPPPGIRPVVKKGFRLRRRPAVAALILLALALSLGAGVYIRYFRTASVVGDPRGGGGKGGGEERIESSGDRPAAVRESVASVEAKVAEIVPVPVGRTWKDVAGVVALIVPLLLLPLWFYLWLRGKLNADDRPDWNPRGPRHFPLSSITGPLPPHLDSQTLDQIADSFGYFQSDRPSRILDVEASVKAAGRNCGLPILLYQKRRQLRSVYILEDAYAEPLSWNPVSRELAEGLGRRGISVRYGKFYGSPDKFHLADGTVVWLEDMEDHRGNYMLLLFSDGKSLSPNRDAFLLEALGRWPLVAWMELREPRFWDESAALPAGYGIPVHHASRAGLLAAVRRFLTESGTPDSRSRQESRWRGAPANVGTDLAAYVERLLGDALPWAQASAMLQPITLGMAHALRREFLKHLPPERVERLFLLPGTTRSVAGLRFSVPVLAVLRAGFASHWDEGEQEEVIRFILGKIKEAEPPEKDSLAHLAWEYSLERVRLELEPDKALDRLTQLEKTPLGGAIRADLENVILPGGEPAERPTRVPLRLKPESQKALRQLAHFAPGVGYAPASLLYGFGNGLRRLLRALRLLWGRFQGLPSALAAWLGRLPGKARRRWRGADAAGGGGARGIVADPPRLVIRKSVGRNERKFRLPRIKVSGGVSLLTAVVSTDSSNWLCVEGDPARIRAELPPERRYERLIDVLADVRELQSGRHEGNVIVVGSGDELAIPIELTVTHGFRERLAHWWQEHRRGWQIKLALVSALIAALTYFTAAALRPDWINRIYNRPPTLRGINLPDTTLREDERLELSADATDPDGDQLYYDWETEGGGIDEKQQTAFLSVAGRKPPAGASHARVNVDVRLTDSRGGRASYRAAVDLVTNDPRSGEQEVIAPGDAPATASPAPTAEPPQGIQAIVNEDKREALHVTVRGVSSDYFTRFSVRPLGRHALRLAAGEYRISVWIGSFRLVTDQPLTVAQGTNEDYRVGQSTLRIIVYSSVPGVMLLVDGGNQGLITREGNIDLVEGRHMIEVKKPGYKTWIKEVVVKFDGSRLDVADKDAYLIANLEMDPSSELFGYYERALKESEQARYDDALRTVGQGLRKYPSNEELEELRAEIMSDKAQNLVRAKVKEEFEADYVAGAEAFGGGLKVSVTIDAEGNVTSAKAAADLRRWVRQAAEEAALRWKFEPARAGGSVPTASRRMISVKFKSSPTPTPTPTP